MEDPTIYSWIIILLFAKPKHRMMEREVTWLLMSDPVTWGRGWSNLAATQKITTALETPELKLKPHFFLAFTLLILWIWFFLEAKSPWRTIVFPHINKIIIPESHICGSSKLTNSSFFIFKNYFIVQLQLYAFTPHHHSPHPSQTHLPPLLPLPPPWVLSMCPL